MKRKTAKSKSKEHRGEGRGADYKPYIQAREFNSIGTCSNVVDWKTGRTMELLSQGELAVFYMLRWDDNNEDIREQYPLDMQKFREIADREGVKISNNPEIIMTTDFLVTTKNGSEEAYSVKFNKDVLEDKRTVEKLYIEKKYWQEKGVQYHLKFTEEINMTLVNNLRLVMEYYDSSKVHDAVSLIKHKIATKQITVDITNEILDFSRLERFTREDGMNTL